LTTTPSPELIILVKSVTVQVAYETITLPAGTNVRFISRDGDNVRFHYVDADYEIPVDATDLPNTGDAAGSSPAESAGPNRVAIRPLKKTYIQVIVDNESAHPAFERWISPADGTVELFRFLNAE